MTYRVPGFQGLFSQKAHRPPGRKVRATYADSRGAVLRGNVMEHPITIDQVQRSVGSVVIKQEKTRLRGAIGTLRHRQRLGRNIRAEHRR